MCESKTNNALQVLTWQGKSVNTQGRMVDINRHMKRHAVASLMSKQRVRVIAAYIKLVSLYRRGSVNDAADSLKLAVKANMIRRFMSNTWFKIAFILAKMAANGSSQPLMMQRVMMYRLVAVG